MLKKIESGVRVLFGLLFLVSGVSFFIFAPPSMQGAMAVFFQGLQASKYFFPLLKITEILCGLCLITGVYVPLALVVLAPIIINIFMVHVFLAPEGMIIALVIGAIQAYLAFFSKQYSGPIRRLFNK